MTQTLELTPSELALIENARKQEVLAQEAKALQNAARIEEDIRNAIREGRNSLWMVLFTGSWWEDETVEEDFINSLNKQD